MRNKGETHATIESLTPCRSTIFRRLFATTFRAKFLEEEENSKAHDKGKSKHVLKVGVWGNVCTSGGAYCA